MNIRIKLLKIKKYNYRQKAKNYMLEDNILFFTGFAGKNNIKLMIPFEKEKVNILKKHIIIMVI